MWLRQSSPLEGGWRTGEVDNEEFRKTIKPSKGVHTSSPVR